MKAFCKSIALICMVALVAVSSVACKFYGGRPAGSGEISDSFVASQNVELNVSSSGRTKLDMADAVAKVERSAVAIKVSASGSTSGGSGVIIKGTNTITNESEYYILTCHHVVRNGGNITVYAPDENCRNVGDPDYNADYMFSGVISNSVMPDVGTVSLVGGDYVSDIAVLKLNLSDSWFASHTLVPAEIAPETYQERRGETVFAIGNPTGELPGTVSMGVVSYINRQVIIAEVGYMNLLQIDVQTNPGSSGGGLFNLYGELIGITNAGSTSYDGTNYAIPRTSFTDELGDSGFVSIAKQLIGTVTSTNYGYVSGRWRLGISVSPSTNSLGTVSFIYVTYMEENGNAKKSGVMLDDIILGVKRADGTALSGTISVQSEFSAAMYILYKECSIGDTFTLIVERVSGRTSVEMEITITLTEQFIFCNTGL